MKSEMTNSQLEWRLIYAMIVAGKSATFANAAVKQLQMVIPRGCLRIPIQFLGTGNGRTFLEAAKTGNYALLEKGLRALVEAKFDLSTVTPEELEQIPGIGPKTSRFFVLWTRPDEEHAVLDRHILRWLIKRGRVVPRDIPLKANRYRNLEVIFLQESKKAGKTPRELDLEIWRASATAENIVEDVE